jgi:transporter family-2 protein
VQLVLSLAILVVARTGVGGLGGAFRTPAWMWLGGVMGATVVFAITFAQPRIGATATIGILIAGQLVMGAAIDRYGLFGVERIDISLPRAVGIVLLGIGAALSLVR